MKSKLLLAPLALIFAANVAVANVKPEPQHGFIFAPKAEQCYVGYMKIATVGLLNMIPCRLKGRKAFRKAALVMAR